MASYEAAHRRRREPDPSLLRGVIVAYKSSRDFLSLRERTRADYLKQIAKVESAFGDLPVDALDDPRVTKDFLDWRDGMASSPRQADYAWTVLMRVISWARGRGLTNYRPPDRVERLYHADRADNIWTEENISAFMAVAPETLQRALVLGLETGQRQGDLLVLSWGAYDGTWVRLRQSKTGRAVRVPVTRRLRAVIENTPRKFPCHPYKYLWTTVAAQRLQKGVGSRKPQGGCCLTLPFMTCVERPSRGSRRPNVRLRRLPPSRDIACAMWGPSWTAIPRAPTSSLSPLSPSSRGADGERLLILARVGVRASRYVENDMDGLQRKLVGGFCA